MAVVRGSGDGGAGRRSRGGVERDGAADNKGNSDLVNSVAARLRILERRDRQRSNEGCEKDSLPAAVVATAAAAHDLLDRALGLPSHSLSRAIRRSLEGGFIDDKMGRRLFRLSRAADAVRHIIKFSMECLIDSLEKVLGGGSITTDDVMSSSSDVDRPDSVAQHALALAEMAVRGVDLVLSKEVGVPPLPADVMHFPIVDGLEDDSADCDEQRDHGGVPVVGDGGTIGADDQGVRRGVHVAVQTSACPRPRKGRVNGRAVQCSVASAHVAVQVHTYSPEVADKSMVSDLDGHDEGKKKEMAAGVASGADVAPAFDWAAVEALLDEREALGRKAVFQQRESIFNEGRYALLDEPT